MPVLLRHKIKELRTKFAGFLLAKLVPLNQDPAQLPLHRAGASFLTFQFAPGWVTSQRCIFPVRTGNASEL